MAYAHLLTERQGEVEHLTLNRPDVRNAFNDEMIAELTDWAAGAASDRGIRAAVVSGAGKSFSAGADLNWMAKTISYSEAANLDDAGRASAMFAALDALPFPLIGRIHGAALGGGAGLAAVCDIAVAADDALFGFTEVRLGILPAVISPFVLAKIGRSAARELFLTGGRFSAARAREIGLVHAVVPAAALDVAVQGYVVDVLAGSPSAIAIAKTLIAQVKALPLDEARPLTARAIAAQRVSAEGQDGLRAFLDKRPPGWSRP
jgi:methylglutaconyl-CoA hydratase